MTEPAFPSNRDMNFVQTWDHEPGMSLLDYFAAKAMQGLLASSTDPNYPLREAVVLAEDSYDYAAAMLAERARRAATAVPAVAQAAGAAPRKL